MIPFNFKTFSGLLAAYLAAHAAGGAIEYAGSPRALWDGQADEQYATDPYHVLRRYGGGSVEWVPTMRIAYQVMTTGKVAAQADAAASAVFAALLDADNRPKRMVDLGSNYRALGFFVRPPAPLAIAANNRTQFAFNFDVVAALVA